MRFAVIVFPGTWSDGDCHYALNDVLGQPADYVWHRQSDLSRYDCIVLPGGFSYGDYLRTGAIARFSPVMEAVVREARRESWSWAFATASRSCARRGCCPALSCATRAFSTAASG